MTGLTVSRWAVASAGAAAVHVLAGPYTDAAVAVTAVYRLPAELARGKMLVDLVTRPPAGTIVVVEKAPGGPGMWVRVGDGLQFLPRPEVWRGR